MKTYKKGISLIVLVITVIVLAILATTVIISLSNTNIISQANNAVFKSDMQGYKEMYTLYLADKLAEDKMLNSSAINAVYGDDTFKQIFGDNVPEKYSGLMIKEGKIYFSTTDATKLAIVEQLGMKKPPIIPNVGDLVEYIPTASATGSYSGATYVMDTDSTSDTYNTYIESTTNYTPGTLKWVYLGQDENGNALLTSQETTSFTMTIAGQDGFVTGPDRIDDLCNTLYGNTTYAKETRNMKIEDVFRLFDYDGPLGMYQAEIWEYDEDGNEILIFNDVYTDTPIKVTYTTNWPRLASEEEIAGYTSNAIDFRGGAYKESHPNEYKTLFKKADGETFLSHYFLSSKCIYENQVNGEVSFLIFDCIGHSIGSSGYGQDWGLYQSNREIEDKQERAIRPVIVLNSNIQFGEKNAAGEWTLIEM